MNTVCAVVVNSTKAFIIVASNGMMKKENLKVEMTVGEKAKREREG